MEPLILCGASVRAAARAARHSRPYIVGVDLFGDADTRDYCQHWIELDRESPGKSLLEALKFSGLSRTRPAERSSIVDGSSAPPSTSKPRIPIVFTGGYEVWGNSIRGAVADLGDVMAPSWSIVETLKDPGFLKTLASSSGSCFPHTVVVLPQEFRTRNSRMDNQSFLGLQASKRWLVKPQSSCGGVGIYFHSSGAGEENTHLKPNEKLLIQEFVPGIPVGANFVSNGSEAVFLGATRSATVSNRFGHFTYGGSWGPCSLGSEEEKILENIAKQLVSSTGLQGIFGVDVLIDRSSQTIWLLEINPRYTASMELVERTKDCSLVDAHLDAMTSRGFDLKRLAKTQPQPNVFAKQIVWAPKDLIWEVGSKPNPFFSNGEFGEIELADIPLPGTLVQHGYPLVTLIAHDTNWRTLLKRIRGCTKQILANLSQRSHQPVLTEKRSL